MFPRLSIEVSAFHQAVQKKFLIDSVRLEIDRTKCRNCGTCISACPNKIIKRGHPDPAPRNKSDKKPVSVLLDAKNCSYCGTCAYLCPYDALSLVVDGKKVERDELQLVMKKALPRLVEEEVTLKDGSKARKFMDGYLKYDKDTCQDGCSMCAEACPTGTIVRYSMLKSTYSGPSPTTGWKLEYLRHQWGPEALEIHRENCIQCGACAFTCPVSAMQIVRQKINAKGEFQDSFWPDTVKRLLDYHTQEPERVSKKVAKNVK